MKHLLPLLTGLLLLSACVQAAPVLPFRTRDFHYRFVDPVSLQPANPYRYDWVKDHRQGPFWRAMRGEFNVLVDTGGKEVLATSDNISDVYALGRYQYTVLGGNGRYGLWEATSGQRLPLEFEQILAGEEGYVLVRQQGKWGAVDLAGKILVQPTHSNLNFLTPHIVSERRPRSVWLQDLRSGDTIIVDPGAALTGVFRASNLLVIEAAGQRFVTPLSELIPGKAPLRFNTFQSWTGRLSLATRESERLLIDSSGNVKYPLPSFPFQTTKANEQLFVLQNGQRLYVIDTLGRFDSLDIGSGNYSLQGSQVLVGQEATTWRMEDGKLQRRPFENKLAYPGFTIQQLGRKAILQNVKGATREWDSVAYLVPGGANSAELQLLADGARVLYNGATGATKRFSEGWNSWRTVGGRDYIVQGIGNRRIVYDDSFHEVFRADSVRNLDFFSHYIFYEGMSDDGHLFDLNTGRGTALTFAAHAGVFRGGMNYGVVFETYPYYVTTEGVVLKEE